jgi:hypothetical protein
MNKSAVPSGSICQRSPHHRLVGWLMRTYPLTHEDAGRVAVWAMSRYSCRSVCEYQAYCRAHFHRVMGIHQPRCANGRFAAYRTWKWTRARMANFSAEVQDISLKLVGRASHLAYGIARSNR